MTKRKEKVVETSDLTASGVMQDTMRAWATAEAADINSAPEYRQPHGAVPDPDYVDRMNADLTKRLERRWDFVVERCAAYGVAL